MKMFLTLGHKAHRRSQIAAVIGFFAVVSIAVAAGVGGFRCGWHHCAEQEAGAAAAASVAEYGCTEAEETRSQFDTMDGRLGRLQAEILRLDVLGERLAAMAGLNTQALAFDNLPPRGGPEPRDARQATAAELTEEMNLLFSELQDYRRKPSLLDRLMLDRAIEGQSLPAGSPVRSGYITSLFGYRRDPINGRKSLHSGVDFAGQPGTDVIAVGDGLIVFSGRRQGYGNTVEIRHDDGLVTLYGHNRKLLVKDGESVKRGQAIATLGSSGRSTGPHVHFEVIKDGRPIDPMKFIAMGGRESDG